jgi:hypothetical protein
MVEFRCRPATQDDIAAYFGEPQRVTVKAIVATLDGVPAGVIGIARQGKTARLFSEFRPEVRPYLKSMTALRAIKAMSESVKQSRLPVYAMVQEDEPDSPRILERLGFVPHELHTGVYVWRDSAWHS